MKRMASFELRVSNWAVLALLALGGLAGCASAPSFPDPKPGEGQIVVELKGEPREGVSGPARETVIGDYEIKSESVEKGKAFERVDYDEIADVVVLLSGDNLSGTVQQAPSTASLTAGEAGFDHLQLLLKSGSKLTINNQREAGLTFVGFSDTDEFFEFTVDAGGKGETDALGVGIYEVMCDEDENLHCTLYVIDSPRGWFGSSDEFPFFDGLAPGTYEVTVYPPRLPEIASTVKVTAGKRSKVTAELTVNDLPKAE